MRHHALRLTTILPLLTLITATALVAFAPAVAAPDVLPVGYMIDSAKLRVTAADDAEPLLKLPVGASVAIVGDVEAGFYPVIYGGVIGWIETGLVETPDRHAANATAPLEQIGRRQSVVTAARLNVRQSPSTESAVVTALPRGEPVTLTGETRDGYLAVTVDGVNGWVLGKHVSGVADGIIADPSLLRRRDVIAIIAEAAAHYGQDPQEMLRVARCESDLVPNATNTRGGSYGLFQFKPGTWAGTPYADYDIFDPRANAYAAAWMWSEGLKHHWVCQ